MNVSEQLTAVFREVFGDPTLVITDQSTAMDVDGWDSLSHVNLIVAVELRFGVQFNQRELLTLRNVGDLRTSLERKLGT